jgi:phosphoribosylformylglycinamidine synthase
MSSILHYYRETEPPHSLLPSVKEQLKSLNLSADADAITAIDTESCFNVQYTKPLSDIEKERLEWLLAETFEKEKLRLASIFQGTGEGAESSSSTTTTTVCLEYGPRMSFASAFSSNAVSICQACGLNSIDRFERSRRYLIHLNESKLSLTPSAMDAIHSMLHDRMTEQEYKEPISTFDIDVETKGIEFVPIMEEGRDALEKINAEKGLGFDDFDLDYYTKLFKVSIELLNY